MKPKKKKKEGRFLSGQRLLLHLCRKASTAPPAGHSCNNGRQTKPFLFSSPAVCLTLCVLTPTVPKNERLSCFLFRTSYLEKSAFDVRCKSGISGPAVTAAMALSSHSALQTWLLRLSLPTGFVIQAIPSVNGQEAKFIL